MKRQLKPPNSLVLAGVVPGEYLMIFRGNIIGSFQYDAKTDPNTNRKAI